MNISTPNREASMGNADDLNSQWADMLARWAIPERLLTAAARSPYFFDPAVFTVAADASLARTEDTPSDAVAREALSPGDTVLDVGVGAGAASLRLDAVHITGVDPSGALLRAFQDRATRRGTEATAVEGRWPDVAPLVPVATVAVCHHVVYNVPDLAGFATALSQHAERRVVIELTAVHPMAWMAPYWEAVHGLTQPDRPIARDAAAVLGVLGFDVHEVRWNRAVQMMGETGEDQVARIARRLCLPDERLDELRQLVAATPPPQTRDVVTLWWDR
jgi:hypothetical protein